MNTIKRITLAATVALGLLVGVAGVSVAPASAAGTIRCYDMAFANNTKNVFGQTTHGVTNEVRWCSNGSAITSNTRYPTYNVNYLWKFNGFSNVTVGGNGASYMTYIVRGNFQECAAYCFNSATNTVTLTVYANGAYRVS